MSRAERPDVAERVDRVLPGASVYLDRKVVAILFLGFASGLPLMLLGRTLTAWLSEAGVDKSTIGLFGFVFAPYAFKFAWAPIVDRIELPLFGRLGRRRGWLLLFQLCLVASIFALGQVDPGSGLFLTACLSFLVAFFSASQDIVIDAFRIEILRPEQQGAGSANVVTGYRVGMWVATAGALFLADRVGWPATYTAMAGLVLVGTVTALLTPEQRREPAPVAAGDTLAGRPSGRRYLGIVAGAAGLVGLLVGSTAAEFAAAGAGWWLGLVGGLAAAALVAVLGLAMRRMAAVRQTVIEPFQDFLGRNGVANALLILAFISVFKSSDVLLTLMANPFYLEVGFTKSQIGVASGTFGFLVTFVGSYIAGMLIYRIGLMRALWLSAVLMLASNLMFAVQAQAGANYPLLFLTLFVENLSGGMGTTAFVAYLASLCDVRYTAVQYALLTSFMQILAKFVTVPSSGFLVDMMGWTPFFVASAAAGLPALGLLWLLGRRDLHPDLPAAGQGRTAHA
ncbi:AmpG family muropeptide MFS transporter [Marinivivus vitaminiproducens]|uniref:AmpG family muropeptide MFS transporter n=1 Tax=Marinivivus vitaminiproducens TaxID=3035935 RepID=UPI0027A54481|nr:MFS transporter [Geminicoccaceae bacterium SCSIO 64248]